MSGNTVKKTYASIAIGVCTLLALSLSSVYANQAVLMVRILPPLAVNEDGSVDYHTNALTPTSIFPMIAVEGMESVYEVRMPVVAGIPRGGTISFLLPSGFELIDSCETVTPADENKDINGMADGTVPIVLIECVPSKFRVTVTLGAAVQAREYLHFYIQGITNGSGVSTSVAGNVIGVETRYEDGGIIELITSLPFFLTPAGTQKISGTLFNDNGAGLLGFAGDGIQSGSELGLPDASVCLNSPNGSRCQTTNVNGAYVFSQLRDGLYGVSVPSMTSGSIIGGPFYMEVELFDGNDKAGINFAFASADRTVTVHVMQIPDQTDVQVFASGGADGSGYLVRDIPWNGQTTRSVPLPVSDGSWSVGVNPIGDHAPSFIVPAPKNVTVSGGGTYEETLYLYPALLRIVGRIVGTHDEGIPNAVVYALPRDRTDSTTHDLATQSLSDGSFKLTLSAGFYRLYLSAPGMPSVGAIDVEVREDSGNGVVDNNTDADVYRDATLVTNNGNGDTRDLTFRIPRGERSISGRVLDESGGPIAFAVVSAEEIDADGGVVGAHVERPTDATGQFTLFVTDGRFRLRAMAPTAGDIRDKTLTLSGKNLSGQDMRISLSQYGTVKGRITKGGKGLAGVFVGMSGSSGTASALSDGDGNYSMRVKAGSGYEIEATVKGAGSLASIKNVTVTAGSITDQKNFSINTPGTVVVTITGVTDAFVDVRDVNFNGDGTSVSQIPGQYRVSVAPGTYTVTAQHPSYGVVGKKSGVNVSSGATVAVSFSVPTSFTAQGAIISDGASCKDSATVSVVDTANGRLIETTTDVRGVYALTLSSGIYAMTASKKGCIDGDAPLFFVVKGNEVVIDDRRLVLAASPLSGSVQIGGKHVSFETKVIAESLNGTVQSVSVDTTIQSGNNYTLSLTAGTWILFARADGYESSKHTVVITSTGRTLNVSLANIPGYIRTERVTTPLSPSKGGVVKNTDAGEKFAVVLPAGALGSSSESGSVSTKVTTAIVAKTPTAEVVGGKGIEITPKDGAGKPISSLTVGGGGVKISLPYSKQEIAAAGIDESKLMLAVWSDSKQQWTPFATTIDSVNAVLSGAPPHFSVFAPIVPRAPPTPAALLSTSTSAQESVTPISGTVLVQPSSPQSTAQSSQSEQESAVKQEVPRGEEVSGPFIISSPPIGEKALVESPASSPTAGQKGESLSTVKSTKRFPSSRVVSLQPKQRTVTESADGKKTSVPVDVFELSVAVDEASRTLTNDTTLMLHGEVIKSALRREPIQLRFIISHQNGVRILDQREEFVLGEHGVFTKEIELSDDIPAGYYTVTTEATYRNETVSSADQFFVSRPTFPSAQIIRDVHDSSKTGILKMDVLLAGLALFLLTICGIVQAWYTLLKALHRKA